MLDFLVMGLATWRLSAMFSYEDGPWKIFRRFRNKIGIEHVVPYPSLDGEENIFNATGGMLADLFSCVWCLSLWFAIIIVIFYQLWPGGTLIVCSPFALSAVAVITERIARG